MNPVFKNRPNPEYQIEGKTIWNSRSVAIVGIILAKFDKEIYALIERRSDTMLDQPGKWCLPCGYIDWDENGWQAITRELYEETSFYLPNYDKFLITRNHKQPFYVNTETTENRQNIVLYFGMVYNFKEGLPLSVLSHKDPEIADVKWVRLNEINRYSLVFGHDRRIIRAEEYFSYHLLPWWKRWIKRIFCR
jgi:8-oxo-dGTP pyrophosphatase MutT (NUDIX family)